MSVKNVVQVGYEGLRKVCEPIKKFDADLHALLADLRDTVRAQQGAGLAAPQIDVNLRVVVVDVDEGYFELINPVILFSHGKQVGAEGCLSVVGKQGIVERPYKVKIEYRDRVGKKHTLTADGFFARAICHELDHLDGILYIDKATDIKDVEED